MTLDEIREANQRIGREWHKQCRDSRGHIVEVGDTLVWCGLKDTDHRVGVVIKIDPPEYDFEYHEHLLIIQNEDGSISKKVKGRMRRTSVKSLENSPIAPEYIDFKLAEDYGS